MCAVAYSASVEEDWLSACLIYLSYVSVSGAVPVDSSSLGGPTAVLQEVFEFVI
jgi:hypothetical protein